MSIEDVEFEAFWTEIEETLRSNPEVLPALLKEFGITHEQIVEAMEADK